MLEKAITELKRLKPESDIKEVLWKIGVSIEDEINGMQFSDDRTNQLIKMYKFYKYSPHAIDKSIWFEAFNIISETEPRLF